VALVFGAGAVGPGWGNGKASAVLYAREGAKVFAVDVDLSAAVETRAIIEAEGGICVAHAADVSRADEIERAVLTCISTFGAVDIVHNNVGIVEVGRADRDHGRELGSHVGDQREEHVPRGQVRDPSMLQQGRGAFVNISSLAAIRYPGFPRRRTWRCRKRW
jgi:NAD(P)-dependent dehydrogenase (short-subunit alcohol dehydrogenase family)